MNTMNMIIRDSNVEPARHDDGYLIFEEEDGGLTSWRRNQRDVPPMLSLLLREVRAHHVNDQYKNKGRGGVVICEPAFHRLLHQRLRAYRATGSPHAARCIYCHQWGVEGLRRYLRRDGTTGFAVHPPCQTQARMERVQP